MIRVSELKVKLAATVPKFTAVAPVKPVPVIVTTVPPAVLPLVGLTLVTAGAAAAVYVKWSEAETADVPVGLLTTTSTVPAASAGEKAVIEVSELTVKLVAALLPKVTAVAPVKALPVIVTDVPPAVLPLVGLTLVTDGAREAV